MSSSSVMLSLGGISFSIQTNGYDNLSRKTQYRWVSTPRIGQQPGQQYLGIGSDTINLDGIIYPEESEHLEQVSNMRSEAEKGTPLLLADQYGYLHGYYVIKAIEEKQSYFFEEGTPRKIEFAISLEAWA